MKNSPLMFQKSKLVPFHAITAVAATMAFVLHVYRCVRSLYVLDGTIPVCRICLGMVYSSQNATFSYRLYKKLKSTKNKLNNDEWTKPRWMRKKTYNGPTN
jgi:hypothetical protein